MLESQNSNLQFNRNCTRLCMPIRPFGAHAIDFPFERWMKSFKCEISIIQIPHVYVCVIIKEHCSIPGTQPSRFCSLPDGVRCSNLVFWKTWSHQISIINSIRGTLEGNCHETIIQSKRYISSVPNWSVAIAGSAKVGTGGSRDHCQFPLAHHPKRKNA